MGGYSILSMNSSNSLNSLNSSNSSMVELSVTGMSCGHCVKAVEKALQGVAGVAKVQVDLAGQKATVELENAVSVDKLLPELLGAVTEEGYSAGLVSA